MNSSLYVDTETKRRVLKLKPPRQSIVHFINTVLDTWEGLTPQERIQAINAKKEILDASRN